MKTHQLFFIILSFWVSPLWAQGEASYKLNGPLATDGDVAVARISPDGKYVVYTAKGVNSPGLEIFSVSINGGTPVRLNSNLPVGNASVLGFVISPDSKTVVYHGKVDSLSYFHAYSVPITGGAPALLNLADYSFFRLGPAQVTNIQISPNSQHVVYKHDYLNFNQFELYSVPITGGQTVRLNPLYGNGQLTPRITYKITADSARVVYTLDRVADNQNPNYELFSVPIEGGASNVDPSDVLTRLTLPNQEFGRQDFRLTSDSQNVVYRAENNENNIFEIFKVVVTGGAPIKLSTQAPESVGPNYILTQDSTRIVYKASRLYSVPLNGSVTQLSPDDVGSFKVSSDSQRVVYRSDHRIASQTELFSVPIGGGATARINHDLAASDDVDFTYQLSATAQRVVYRIRKSGNNLNLKELYSAPITGGPMVRLNANMPAGGVIENNFEISANGKLLIYVAQQNSADKKELFSVSITGGVPERLNDDLAAGGNVMGGNNSLDYYLSRDGKFVIYLADQNVDEQREIFARELPRSNDDDFCLPLVTANQKVVVICL